MIYEPLISLRSDLLDSSSQPDLSIQSGYGNCIRLTSSLDRDNEVLDQHYLLLG
jgi:hypothetical protein